MKLIYWCAPCLEDSAAYSIRTRTLRECKEKREEYGAKRFGMPRKVTIEYADGFDLLTHCMGEGSITYDEETAKIKE